ncbi:MAG: hypothetical protein M3229_04920, partial [Actinomycetota bacterium]|nr:hypothetical protein [Actinomycetota bacterium]
MRPGLLLSMLVVVGALVLPVSAFANDFQEIFGDYKTDGRIDGCYDPHEIHNAGQAIPPDIEQYSPGFGDALSSAQTTCDAATPSAPEEAAAPPPSTGGTSGAPPVQKKKTVPEPPAPKFAPPIVPTDLTTPRLATAAISSETPGALIALLVAAGLAALLAIAWGIAWFMGWSPERLTKPL